MTSSYTLARVENITPLTNSVLQITLVPETFIPYLPGQYLKLIFNSEAFYYSIANAPLGAHKYELHIRHTPENPYNEPLLAHIKHTGQVRIHMPFGQCHIEALDPKAPIICIAGGTGFAPIKAMIEQWLADGDTRPCALYWGARSKSDLYLDELVIQWEKHVTHFKYIACLSGDQDTISPKVLSHHASNIHKHQFVIAGPFDMAYTLRDKLVKHGASSKLLFSDAYDFKP